MTPKLLITLSSVSIFLSGCLQHAYYQSPFQSNTSTYKAMPLASEGRKSANYMSATLFGGGANQRWRDGMLGFTGSFHRSHVLGNFRAFYGMDVNLAGYHVTPLYAGILDDGSYPNDSLIYARSGWRFFGGLGPSGGIYVAQELDNGGEWRIIGTELSWRKEFGSYYSFRKNLPDTAANLNSRHSDFMTIGVHSDLSLKTHAGSVGFKLGAVFSTRQETVTRGAAFTSPVTTGYFSGTTHFTTNRITGFWQTNIGTWSFITMIGINYRL